jgi:hypothetical protein
MMSKKIMPFPSESFAILEKLAATSSRPSRPDRVKRLDAYPEKIVIRVGERKFYVGVHLLTQEDVPVYEVEGTRHDSQDSAIDAIYGGEAEIVLED